MSKELPAANTSIAVYPPVYSANLQQASAGEKAAIENNSELQPSYEETCENNDSTFHIREGGPLARPTISGICQVEAANNSNMTNPSGKSTQSVHIPESLDSLQRSPEHLSWPEQNVLKWENKHLGEGIAHLSEENFIGRGGQGTVYKGKVCCGEKHERHVAVKVLHQDCRMLQQEEMKDLCHPFVMPVWHVSENHNLSSSQQSNPDSIDFVAYPYMEKKSLRDHVVDSENPLSYKDRIRITSNSADGLAHLHKKWFILRDVKSANIFLDSLNNPRFGDYGLVVTKMPDCSRIRDSGKTFSTTSTCSSDRSLRSVYGSCVKGTPGWVCPIYNTTHRVDQRCDLWGFGMVMLQLLTGEPIFRETHDVKTEALPLFVRLGLDEILENKEKAVNAIFSSKETVTMIRMAGWPAMEDNDISKKYAELALRCLSISKLSDRIPLDELRKNLKDLMKREGIEKKDIYKVPDDTYCIYCLCRKRDKAKLTCGHQIACRDCLQNNSSLYCPFDGDQYSAIGHPGVFSIVIASSGLKKESNGIDQDVFVKKGPDMATGLRKNLHLRDGNVISFSSRSEKKATSNDVSAALGQLVNKVKEVKIEHKSEITLVVLLLGYFQKEGKLELDDSELCFSEITEKLKNLNPENLLVFAIGPGAKWFGQKIQHWCDEVHSQPSAAINNANEANHHAPEHQVNNNALRRWVAYAFGFVQRSLSWITSWFSSTQLPQHEGESQSAEIKSIGFNNVFLSFLNNDLTELETRVFSNLCDCILHGLEGTQRCPLEQENTGQDSCEKCSNYHAEVKTKGIITAGDFINYVCNHSGLIKNGTMCWNTKNKTCEVTELQLAYSPRHESDAFNP